MLDTHLRQACQNQSSPAFDVPIIEIWPGNAHEVVSFSYEISLKEELPASNFAERVKKARKGLGLFQKELAARAGVSEATILNYEKGKTEAGAEILRALARTLKVPVQWLRDGDGGEYEDFELKRT